MLGNDLVLLLRSSQGGNAIARVDIGVVRSGIGAGRIEPPADERIAAAALGDLAGVPFGFTDAATIDGRLLFSAAAEDTDNAYDDGAVMGSMVGELVDGAARDLAQLPAGAGKVEGLAVERRGGELWALLVTDDDDHTRASRMYELRLA